jgi:hypothetical protein
MYSNIKKGALIEHFSNRSGMCFRVLRTGRSHKKEVRPLTAEKKQTMRAAQKIKRILTDRCGQKIGSVKERESGKLSGLPFLSNKESYGVIALIVMPVAFGPTAVGPQAGLANVYPLFKTFSE